MKNRHGLLLNPIILHISMKHTTNKVVESKFIVGGDRD